MRTTALALMLLSSFVAVTASATTMQTLDMGELTYVADLVVEATVEANSVERVEGSEFLRTATTLRITRVLKGDASEGERVDVLALGGRLGTEETTIASAPVFTPEERVLLFLELRNGAWRCVGLSQGKLTLVEEPGTGLDAAVHVSVPRGLERFEETRVQLPLRPRYLDDVVATIQDDIALGFVPEYRSIAGLPVAKDVLFRAEARAAGKYDQRWDEVAR